MSNIHINFESIIKTFIEELNKQGMSEEEGRLFIASDKGKAEFLSYCDACIRLQVDEQLGTEQDKH